MARKVNYGDVLYFSSRHFLRKFSLRKSRSRSRSKSACMYFQETAQFLDESGGSWMNSKNPVQHKIPMRQGDLIILSSLYCF